jgi:hypothetical protein
VALVHLLAEDRVPPEALWQEPLISSRLIEYEIWTRIHTRKLARSHGDEVRALLGRDSARRALSAGLGACFGAISQARQNARRSSSRFDGLYPNARTAPKVGELRRPTDHRGPGSALFHLSTVSAAF